MGLKVVIVWFKLIFLIGSSWCENEKGLFCLNVKIKKIKNFNYFVIFFIEICKLLDVLFIVDVLINRIDKLIIKFVICFL